MWPEVTGAIKTLFGPAASDIGLLFADTAKGWRLKNQLRILASTQKAIKKHSAAGTLVHPRLAFEAFEYGSWADDERLQELDHQ